MRIYVGDHSPAIGLAAGEPRGLTANVVVGQEPGVRIDEQSLGALPRNPTFAPWSVNIYELPVK